MASIANDPNGRRRLQFADANGRRQTIRLGKMPKRTAESVKVFVEHLLTAKLSKQPINGETARWVASLDDTLADKLAKAGLIQQRDSATLAAFLDGYIAARADVKFATVTNWGHTRRNLVEYFGGDMPLRDITPGQADDWRLYLSSQEELAESTVRKRCSNAKQFFKAAARKKLIQDNPFADLKSAVLANRKRDYFVTCEDARKVLDACPDAQWRLTFALARYGGLRCPSEHLGLRWGDVDWAAGKMLVHSPKTEHHPEGESRWVPIFPELKPYLTEVFEQAEPGTEHVITHCRSATQNLRTHMLRIIRRAGLEPWPKLFQNLRATRETELAEVYPMHVVCAWIGNSRAVAAKHYLQVTDEHFKKATQNPTQTVHVEGVSGGQQKQQTPQLSGNDAPDNTGQLLNMLPVGDAGFEPATSAV